MSNSITILDYDKLITELEHFTLTQKPYKQNNVINKQKRDLLKAFKNKTDLMKKNTDKSNCFALMNTTEYHEKIKTCWMIPSNLTLEPFFMVK